MPQQRPAGAAPAAVDPFLQRQQTVHSPPIGQPVGQPVGQPPAPTTAPFNAPPPNNNPLRTADYVASPQQVPVHISTPPVVPAAPSIASIIAEEPAPPKMTVEVPLALEGFCPVTLCTEERWVAGNPMYCTMYQGHIFRFASGETLATFARNPENYIPVAMGEDIVLMVDRNKRVNGNRKFGAWFQGRVFLFASQETLNVFAERPDFYTEIAFKYELAARKDPAVPVIY
jgi:YHS domain-containing protein